jgi:endonuclease/exonuclease/phosphatase family metal-dependent hydrolase
MLTRGMADAWEAARSRTGPVETFHNFTGKADRRIDWILTRGFTARDARTITTRDGARYPSDHFPVVVDLVADMPATGATGRTDARSTDSVR